MGSNTKVKVSEIFSHAGAAFSRLGELTMQLQTADDGSSKWTDEEIDMLNTAIGRFSSDLSEISYRVKSRGVTQLKQTLKKKAFEDAGIPVKQVALISAAQPSQPVAVAVPQILTIHPSPNVPHTQQQQQQHQFQNVQHIPSGQQSIQRVVPQFQQQQIQPTTTTTAQPQQQQFQFVQHVQQVPLQHHSQTIEVTEISTDDQLNDSQDSQEASIIAAAAGDIVTTAPTAALITDQSMLTLNRLNSQLDGAETSDVSVDAEKLEFAVDADEVAG